MNNILLMLAVQTTEMSSIGGSLLKTRRYNKQYERYDLSARNLSRPDNSKLCRVLFVATAAAVFLASLLLIFFPHPILVIVMQRKLLIRYCTACVY